ncbi:hypothetical protein GOODEAATRI_001426 [Goodea atripinnis]|uniref:Uncharacterized protein n=1 Tax=Goodea atripinnis TaxID=208336 RepID=A0ABV0N784_9TELE
MCDLDRIITMERRFYWPIITPEALVTLGYLAISREQLFDSDLGRDNPPNLSILLSGGKETNKDALSRGKQRGKSPSPNPHLTGGRGRCGVQNTTCPVSLGGLSLPDRGSAHGQSEAGNGPRRAGVRFSRSRVNGGMQPKVGGKIHLRLNTSTRPIVDKYLKAPYAEGGQAGPSRRYPQLCCPLGTCLREPWAGGLSWFLEADLELVRTKVIQLFN